MPRARDLEEALDHRQPGEFLGHPFFSQFLDNHLAVKARSPIGFQELTSFSSLEAGDLV
jgi:hypothetical protein